MCVVFGCLDWEGQAGWSWIDSEWCLRGVMGHGNTYGREGQGAVVRRLAPVLVLKAECSVCVLHFDKYGNVLAVIC